jgi:hypothetical protein
MNEKDCFDDFIVGFDFGVGRVPLVASPRPPPRPSSLQSALRLKMRGLLNSQLSFSNLFKRSLSYVLTQSDYFLLGFF